ncbi:hypothetical protein AI27_05595 [Sphingomonas sp. BHC-A]|nr:hypothetical protein AI27_05595 [Sphingomonas sp. BHC-A]
MTDAFIPMSLSLVPLTPMAIATSEPTLDFLTSPGLRALIAERLEQIEKHGHLPDTDMGYQGAELALAAKSYIDTYIDLELRPDMVREPGDLPESWPFADLYWKEPSPEQRAKALIKGLALGLAELDRLLASLELIRAARPLSDQSEPPQFTAPPANGAWHL